MQTVRSVQCVPQNALFSLQCLGQIEILELTQDTRLNKKKERLIIDLIIIFVKKKKLSKTLND